MLLEIKDKASSYRTSVDKNTIIQIPSMVVLKHTHKFFNTPPFKRWKLIPLPLSVSCTWWLFSNEQNVAKWQWLLRRGPKRYRGFLLLSEISCSRRMSAAMLWHTPSVLWRSPSGKELRGLCQPPCEWALWEANPPAPVKPSDDHSPSRHYECNFMSQNHSGKMFPDSCHRNCEIMVIVVLSCWVLG